MALQEDQIVRFSRQILLREVGGAGQLRLLAATARAAGEGPALATAAAYLTAGGSPVSGPSRPLSSSERGFLTEWPRQPGAAVVDDGCRNVIRSEQGFGIWLGGAGDSGVIVFAGDDSCRACLDAHLETLGAVPEAVADLVGAIAALQHQRHALGLPGLSGDANPSVSHGCGEGRIEVRASGEVDVQSFARCEACR